MGVRPGSKSCIETLLNSDSEKIGHVTRFGRITFYYLLGGRVILPTYRMARISTSAFPSLATSRIPFPISARARGDA